MARYDRIARLGAPPRGEAFPGWPALADLDGREREAELCRRSLARFLTIRPVHRLLRRGLDVPGQASLDAQIDQAATAVAQLPAGDAERDRLGECLAATSRRAPDAMTAAALAVGTCAEAWGHNGSAEEFYRIARELADAHGHAAGIVRSIRALARLALQRGETEEAARLLESGILSADAAGEFVDWAAAVADLARIRLATGDVAGSRALLDRVAHRGATHRDDAVSAVAAAARCAVELADGAAGAAVEAGWHALELIPPTDGARDAVLLDLAVCFRRMGLGDAAASCYRIIQSRSTEPASRIAAGVEYAVLAAESDDADGARSRRDAVVDALAASPASARVRALAELGLGRAAMLIGDVDDARAHLRTAIAIAREARLPEALIQAGDLLTAMEGHVGIQLGEPMDPTAGARKIASRIESLGRELVPTG